MIFDFSSISWSELLTKIFIFLFITSGIIQITPLKINPWSWLARKIGKALNQEIIQETGELKAEVAGVKQDIANLREEIDESTVKNVRIRILRFADDLYAGNRNYSKEHFDTILDDITTYDNYCNSHPSFKNHRTIQAKKFIDQQYVELLQSHGFLGPNEDDETE